MSSYITLGVLLFLKRTRIASCISLDDDMYSLQSLEMCAYEKHDFFMIHFVQINFQIFHRVIVVVKQTLEAIPASNNSCEVVFSCYLKRIVQINVV